MKIIKYILIVPFSLFIMLSWSTNGHCKKGIFSGSFRTGANVTVAKDEMVRESLTVAGANIKVEGAIENKLTAFGANVKISGNVGGELFIAGANVTLSGVFREKVTVSAANVVLSGTFERDVETASAKVTLAPSTVIKGNLTYAAATLDHKEGAEVLGNISGKMWEERTEKFKKWRERGKKRARIASFIFWLLSSGALVILGLVIHYVFPDFTEHVVRLISESPWSSIVLGLAFLVVVPFAILIALITIIGIPVALIAGFIYLVSLYISRIYISVWIGRKIVVFFRRDLVDAFFWPLILGIIVIALVDLIPFLGWLFKLFCLFIGLGAFWFGSWNSIRSSS
jgi:hypothetical protein